MRWTTRWSRDAVRNACRTHCRRARLQVESLEAREVPHIHGTVYLDQNLNGTQDPEDNGVGNVTVTATDEAGTVTTAKTNADGTYELESDAQNLRIVFSDLPPGAQPGRVTDTSGATVRFLTATSDREGVDLALATSALVTTQFYYDRALDGANSDQPAVVSVPYGDENPIPVTLANVSDVGSVWGTAYQSASGSVYVSSFVKRHAGLGPNANGTGTTTGGIYRIDPSTDPATVSLLVDLNTAGSAYATGADPHPSMAESDDGDWFHDAATLPQVGKRGLGGMAMSADGRTLYVVNLNTRELIEVPLNADGSLDSSRGLRHVPVPLSNPAGSGIADFRSSDLRPFAVTVKGNAVFVGETYTAETGNDQSAADLRAIVYAYDPAQGAFRTFNQSAATFAVSGAPTPVLMASLNYPRGIAYDPDPTVSGDEMTADWQRWTSSFDTSSAADDGTMVHPQPWLTSIAFDGGAMILGLRDRFGDQGGIQTGSTKTSDTDNFYSVMAAGDILRAAPNGTGGWKLESGGAAGGIATVGAGDGQGPGNGEFYSGDTTDTYPQEVVTGAVLQVPGVPTVAATGNDPVDSSSGGIYTFFNSNTNTSGPSNAGTAATRTELYSSAGGDTFGDANGLGGLAAMAASRTVQVGDRVFADKNGNGIQDPGEDGIAGVAVQLSQGSTQVGTTTTDANGGYQFNDLQPNTAYQIRIDTQQAALAGRSLAPAAKGTDSNLDSDATLNGSTATVDFTTGAAGSTDTSRDIGFSAGTPAPGNNLTLGDLVFRDANNNGVFDTGDAGIPGVLVELLNSAGAPAGASATTDANGKYTFGSLAAGTYRVRIAAGNFNPGGVLAGYTPSTNTVSDPSNNTNNDNNGTASGALGSGGFILSGPIALAAGSQPTNDGDSDANTNLTLDFGVVPPATTTPTLTLGNLVFKDANKNGVFDAGDTGIDGVTVELLDQNGNPVAGKTTTTSGGGLYSFTGLSAGTYKVRLAASNFTPTSASAKLVGYSPSAISDANPEDNKDNDNNGTASGTLGSGGFVVSGPVTLALNGEPTNDGDTNANTNQTVDFALVQTTAPAPAGSISGRVFLDFDNSGTFNGVDSGVQGVTLTLTGGNLTAPVTIQTDASGNFTMNNLAAGTYTLTEKQPTAPTSQTGKDAAGSAGGNASVSNVISNIVLTDGTAATGYLFAEVPLVGTGGTVFEDTNGNGLKDSGEAGIPGVTITLSGTSVVSGAITPQTAATDASGNYTFNNLTPGAYTLAETQPAGFVDGGEQNGVPAGTVSNDQFAGIDLTSTASPSGGFNFGETKAPSAPGISGVVFDDVNDDGAQAATGEPGIAGVKVRLAGKNDLGKQVHMSMFTDANGAFSFTGLRAGTYRLIETQPKGYTDGTDTAGTSGGDAAKKNDRILNIALAAGAAATGYLFAEHSTVDVAVSQSPSSVAIAPGGKVTITYAVRNRGTATATDVSALVKFGGLKFLSSNSTDFDEATGTWAIGDLAPGAKETIQITYRAGHAGTFTPSVTVGVSSSGTGTHNNKATSTIQAGVVPLWRFGLFWFLSSSTNAYRSRGLWF